MKLTSALAACVLFALAVPCLAQPNVVAGRSVKLQSLGSMNAMGRTGTFPTGVNGCAQTTTSCNNGVGNLSWFQAMQPNHPFISFLYVRESGGRMVQISDRSFLKHGFFATNQNGCGTCQDPLTGSLLGPNCSDTYSTNNNGDNFWLGPADEVDPWLGTWVPNCSHFDAGEPTVPSPQNCDGVRSLNDSMVTAMGPVGHRVRVLDADFNVPGANFYSQAMYTTQGEADALRTDNMGWRKFTATWNGTKWSLVTTGLLTYNSILTAWQGATVTSNTNGADDGRVYVAVKVTGPVNGLYHYEYAVHNRDNKRGLSSFRIPLCPGAVVAGADFDDIDASAANQWSISTTANEIVFNTAINPLKWNTVFNFWFDSDAGPKAGTVSLDQWAAGPGATTVNVLSTTPTELYNVNLAGGCGTPSAPNLHATGNPAKATLGNATFGVEVTSVAASSSLLLWASALDASLPLNASCTLHMNVAGLILNLAVAADGNGVCAIPLPIPANPVIEGLHVNFAAFELQAGGAVAAQADLSNTLRVRLGDLIPGCP